MTRASPATVTVERATARSMPKKMGTPSTPSFPTVATSAMPPSSTTLASEMTALVGKNTRDISSPCSYNWSRADSEIGLNFASNQSSSALGRARSKLLEFFKDMDRPSARCQMGPSPKERGYQASILQLRTMAHPRPAIPKKSDSPPKEGRMHELAHGGNHGRLPRLGGFVRTGGRPPICAAGMQRSEER